MLTEITNRGEIISYGKGSSINLHCSLCDSQRDSSIESAIDAGWNWTDELMVNDRKLKQVVLCSKCSKKADMGEIILSRIKDRLKELEE